MWDRHTWGLAHLPHQRFRASAEAATQAVRRAGVAVLGIEAEALAARHAQLLVDAVGIGESLARFDRVATNIGPLPHAALAVLRDPRNGIDLMRVPGAGEWTEKLNKLLAGDA